MMVVTVRGTDRRLAALLRAMVGNDMLCVETRNAAFCGDVPALILASGQAFERIACKNAAFIVRGNSCLPTHIDCQNAVAIVDSSDAAVMEQVAARRLRALTCGHGRSDTFTFSSLAADSAVVSLQRHITAFNGACVEPFDLPLRFASPVEPFWLLACAAVFCLLDKGGNAAEHTARSPAFTQAVEYGFLRNI